MFKGCDFTKLALKERALMLPDTEITSFVLGAVVFDDWSSRTLQGVSAVAELADALPRSFLTHLDITGAWIRIEGAEVLASALPQTSLTSLNVSDTD